MSQCCANLDAPYWAQTLGLIALQAFSTDEVPVDDVSLGRVVTVLSSFPTPPAGDPAAVSAAADGTTRLVGASMKWCRQCVPQTPAHVYRKNKLPQTFVCSAV